MTKPPTTPAPDLAPGALLDGVDLARQHLAGLSLRGASLRGARLERAHLQDVDLTGADLSGAHLAGAILERVVLDEAHLDGVRAAGLDWSGGSLARAQVAGLEAPGAHLRQVHIEQARLSDAVFDGAFIEECEVREIEIDGCSLVALRLLACRVAGLRVHGCDLGGAEVLDARLHTLALAGGSLRGVRIERAHLARLSLGGCALTGAVFDRCRGLGSEDERVLRAGGAVVLLPAALSALRVLATSRRLQIGVAAAGLLLVAGGAVVPSQPALWPDLLLAGRIRTLVDAGDCAAMDTLAQRLGLRVVDAERPRFELFEAVATCRADAQRAGEGEALLREVVASAGGRRAARLAALGALASFQARFGADADLDTTCAEALDLAEGEGERLQVLRLEESLLRERGLGATPRGPGEPAPEDARWLRLQRDLAVALAASEDLEEGALHGTAADLYVLGEWSLAEGLLVGLDPAAAVRVRCQAVDAAARRLAADGRPDLALALLAQQRVAHPLDPQSALILTRREVGILLAEGRIAEAEALLGPLPEDAPVALMAETGLLRAAVLEAAGQPRAVLDLLAALPTPIPVAFDHVARRAWLTARAWRALGREDEAVVALEPLLTAASSDEIRESMRALGLWAATLAHPEALLDLLGRVENPAFLDGLLAADLTLELVRARAEAGLLAWDDPLLTRLFGGDPALAAQALAIALDRARAQGTVRAAVPALLALVAAIDDAASREAAGLDLAQAALDASAPAAAAEALDRLRLAQSADPDRRVRAEALRAGIALGQDDPAQALASVEVLLGKGASSPEHRDLARRVLCALQDAGSWPAAEVLARRLLAAEPHDPDLLAGLLTGLLAEGRDADLPAALALAPACNARIALARAHQRRGLAPLAPADLDAACGPGAASFLRAEAGRLAADAGDPEAALRITAGLPEDDGLDAYNGGMVTVDRARWLAAVGRSAEGRDAIEARYAATSEPAAVGLLAEGWIDLAAGEPDGLVRVYRRVVADHPALEGEGLWQRAARALVAAGAEERLPELGGAPAWAEGIAEFTLDARYRRGLEAGDFAAAWAALGVSAARGPDPARRRALLDMAGDLGGRPEQGEALLAFLDALGDGEDAARLAEMRCAALLALAEGELRRLGEVPKGRRAWRRRLEQARGLAPAGSAERERVEVLGVVGEALDGRVVKGAEERRNAAAEVLEGWGEGEVAGRVRGG